MVYTSRQQRAAGGLLPPLSDCPSSRATLHPHLCRAAAPRPRRRRRPASAAQKRTPPRTLPPHPHCPSDRSSPPTPATHALRGRTHPRGHPHAEPAWPCSFLVGFLFPPARPRRRARVPSPYPLKPSWGVRRGVGGGGGRLGAGGWHGGSRWPMCILGGPPKIETPLPSGLVRAHALHAAGLRPGVVVVELPTYPLSSARRGTAAH